MFEFKNPHTSNISEYISADINHPIYGWIPFTASPDDTEEHGRELYERAKAGDFGEIAIAPSENCIWDGTKWVEPVVSVEEAIAAKIAEINQARDAELIAGFEYDGNTFDSDSATKARINGLATLALAVPDFRSDFITQDNKTVTLNTSQIIALGEAAAAHEAAIIFKARRLKDQVLAATTVGEVEAIKW